MCLLFYGPCATPARRARPRPVPDSLLVRAASVKGSLPPRVSPPDLPPDLSLATELRRDDDVLQARFEGTRVDEVDSRGVRAEHVDLRGLEALAFTDLSSLRGVTLSARQVELLSTSFAAALGVDVRD